MREVYDHINMLEQTNSKLEADEKVDASLAKQNQKLKLAAIFNPAFYLHPYEPAMKTRRKETRQNANHPCISTILRLHSFVSLS